MRCSMRLVTGIRKCHLLCFQGARRSSMEGFRPAGATQTGSQASSQGGGVLHVRRRLSKCVSALASLGRKGSLGMSRQILQYSLKYRPA